MNFLKSYVYSKIIKCCWVWSGKGDKKFKGKILPGILGITDCVIKQSIKYIINPLVHIYNASFVMYIISVSVN